MRTKFLTTILILLYIKSFCQDSLKNYWVTSINFGIQQHDKRLFDFSGKENLLKTQPEFFGTYQLALSFLHKNITAKKMMYSYGFSLGTELSTFRRPYNHNYGKSSGNDAIRYTDRYYKFLVSGPFVINYNHSQKVSFIAELLPQFSFLTIAGNSKNDYGEKHHWFEFNFHSLEFNPGISFNCSQNIRLELKYRLFQLKKIDEIIFNHIIDDEREATFETYNPLKFWVSFSFKI